MNDSIQQQGDEVAIVIYDAPLPPRYFRFSRKFIKALFVTVPVFLILIFLGLFLWGLGVKLQDTPKPKLPTIVNEQDSRLLQLEDELKSLQDNNAKLLEKLATLPEGAPATEEEPFLLAIKRPYGMQNLLNQKKVSTDNFELVQENNSTALKFQIISSNPETKVSGHVLVFMLSELGLMVYPKEGNATLSSGVKFSIGEPFSVSRLRPTKAEFLQRLAGDSVKFLIYIFNREGDLLLVKETENFKIGTKR